MSTGIEWTDASWNPIRGCSRVSEGCRHCYAETMAGRFSGPAQPYEGLVKLTKRDVRQIKVVDGEATGGVRTVSRNEARWTGEIRFVAEHLADPLKWKKPRRIFVNSMSDLFHERLTNEQIAAVFGVMAAAPQHTFQVLTKRAKRMREWFEWVDKRASTHPNEVRETFVVMEAAERLLPGGDRFSSWSKAMRPVDFADCIAAWPLPNVWLGVSVENQAAADKHIPELLQTPAAVRFLSCEPLLGPLDLRRYMWPTHWSWDAKYETPEAAIAAGAPATRKRQALVSAFAAFVDQVIAGCESGPGARACEVDWLRSLRNQCADTETAFFLKQAKPQLGASTLITTKEQAESRVQGKLMGTIPIIGEGPGSKRKAGGIIGAPYLDGVQHLAFPQVGK